MSEDDTFMARLKEIADAQIEHCDSILILASGPAQDKDGGTVFYRMQRGNSHANEGLAREYLRRLESYEGGYHAETGRHECETHRNGFE
jgi:hypothetical protein